MKKRKLLVTLGSTLALGLALVSCGFTQPGDEGYEEKLKTIDLSAFEDSYWQANTNKGGDWTGGTKTYTVSSSADAKLSTPAYYPIKDAAGNELDADNIKGLESVEYKFYNRSETQSFTGFKRQSPVDAPTLAGEYWVEATFNVDESRYAPIDPWIAKVNIYHETIYTSADFTWEPFTFEDNGLAHTQVAAHLKLKKTVDGQEVEEDVELTDDTRENKATIAKDILGVSNYEYTYYRGSKAEGTPISSSDLKELGKYTVQLELKSKDFYQLPKLRETDTTLGKTTCEVTIVPEGESGPTVQSIAVTGGNRKFYKGAEFVKGALIVTATDSNGATSDVTADATVTVDPESLTNDKFNKTGEVIVTVSYSGKNTTYVVNVTDRLFDDYNFDVTTSNEKLVAFVAANGNNGAIQNTEPVVYDSLFTISTTPGKIAPRESDCQFNTGTKISFKVEANMKVTVTVKDNEGVSINGYVGTGKTVTKYFTEESNVDIVATAATYLTNIKIEKVDEVPAAPTYTGLTVSGAKANFETGDDFVSTGLVVKANYSDETYVVLADGYEVDSTAVDKTTAGDYTITVTYNSKSTTYNVTYVVADTDPDIKVNTTLDFATDNGWTNKKVNHTGATITYNTGKSTVTGTITFTVKAGAVIYVSPAYSGGTSQGSYSVKVGDAEAVEHTGASQTVVATAGTITIASTAETNKLTQIGVAYPVSDKTITFQPSEFPDLVGATIQKNTWYSNGVLIDASASTAKFADLKDTRAQFNNGTKIYISVAAGSNVSVTLTNKGSASITQVTDSTKTAVGTYTSAISLSDVSGLIVIEATADTYISTIVVTNATV